MGKLDALMIRDLKERYAACPNFYVYAHFREYENGRSMEEIVENIVGNYESHKGDFNKHQDIQWEISKFRKAKKKIYFRLINAERNRELLEQIPHMEFLDMAVVFYLLVSNEEEGIGSIRVSNELQERWGVSVREMYDCAMKNTENLFPAKLTCLQSVLGKMLFKMESEEEDGFNMDYLKISARAGEPLVLTNKNGINGFAVILYKDCLKTLGEQLGQDFYILPSSVHESLLVPANGEVGNPKQLRDMVREVNASCVEPEDYLSDEVYYYDREREMIEIVKGEQPEGKELCAEF